MDLTTTFMGLELANPIVPGASPLTDDVDNCRRLEDAGAAAIVMRSLFMEQVLREQQELASFAAHEESFAEATSFVAEPTDFALGPDEYLEKVRAIKEAVDVPVIASLNGTHGGRWTRYAKLMEQAGADGIELNLYHLPLDGSEDPVSVEQRYRDVVTEVKKQVDLPVAVKLTFFHSSPVHMARKMDEAGADGLVLFNRLYLPDIDIEELDVQPRLHLSTSGTLRLRLLWVAACFGRIEADMAVTGGIHTATDAIKAIMAGASTCQMASALLQNGPDHVATVLRDIRAWMEEHEYESVRQMCGSMSLERSPEPEAYERANYLRVLHAW